MKRPTWAEVSRAALRTNYGLLDAQARALGASIIAVIKANAYGHGAREALATLAQSGCAWFAVTSLEEALVLKAGLPPDARMLVLSGLFQGEAPDMVQNGFTPVLGGVDQLEWLANAVTQQPVCETPFNLHLEIDTGMARQGIPWHDTDTLAAFAALLKAHPRLQLEGVMTHFASPEDERSPQTSRQIERFDTALAALRGYGCQPALIHAGNSASLFEPAQLATLHDLATQYNSQLLLRPGIALYGYGPQAAQHGLQSVMSWKTRITALRTIAAGESVSYNATFRVTRPTRIALLPVGYADGYNRLLSNQGEVLVRGQRTPIAGRVTMDQTMIDVTNIACAEINDEVVLLGAQGDQQITADDLAARTGTIAYEVLCAIGARVPRVWLD